MTGQQDQLASYFTTPSAFSPVNISNEIGMFLNPELASRLGVKFDWSSCVLTGTWPRGPLLREETGIRQFDTMFKRAK